MGCPLSDLTGPSSPNDLPVPSTVTPAGVVLYPLVFFCILDYATEEQINFVVRYYTDIMMKIFKPNKVVYTSLGTSMIGTPITCGSCPGAK